MQKIWELDFYSRPILDENGKKVWEVLLCESPLQIEQTESMFRFSKFCPSTQVNSIWLGEAISEAIAESGTPPTKIRFFRQQMKNMITKSCQDLGIDVAVSRRTMALQDWIDERMTQVYPQDPNYKAGPAPVSVRMESPPASPLPDALLGEQWAFVSLAAGDFAEINEWDIGFGEVFPILGEKSLTPGLTPETRIPGAIVFSSRANALAGWMSGLDLAFLAVDETPKARLLLETGGSDRWILANIVNDQTLSEAKGFLAAKENAQQVHFLAVQSDPESESFAGFWLLKEEARS
jgi:hypothetical protein